MTYYDLGFGYCIRVLTGTDSGAGTDSNITLTLTGENGTVSGLFLNKYMHGNAFENGYIDEAVLDQTIRYNETNMPMPDVGDIYSIGIQSDGSWAGSAWQLDRIDVTTVSSNKGNLSYTANFDYGKRWITGASDEGIITKVVPKYFWKPLYYASAIVPAYVSEQIRQPWLLKPTEMIAREFSASIEARYHSSSITRYKLDVNSLESILNEPDFQKKVLLLQRNQGNGSTPYFEYLMDGEKFEYAPEIYQVMNSGTKKYSDKITVRRENTHPTKDDYFNVVFSPEIRESLIICGLYAFKFRVPVGLKYTGIEPPKPPTND